MDVLFSFALSVTLWLQNLTEGLFPLMKGITFLGNEEFYLLLMPILYWCLDWHAGIQIGTLLLLSTGTNALLKLAFHSPRPYWVSDQVKNVISNTDFGFPSGHAQNASSIWGLIALQYGTPWMKVGLAGVIFLIGVSRIILGVHFIHDVFGGWIIGLLLLLIFLLLKDPVSDWFSRISFRSQLVISFLTSIFFILMGLLLTSPLMRYQIPVTWLQNIDGSFDALNLDQVLSIAGALFGLLAGLLLLNDEGGFRNQGTLLQQGLRFGIGISGVLLLWAGLDALFPDDISSLAMTLRYFRYLLIGFWIAYGAPRVFILLNLAQRRRQEEIPG